MVNGEKIKTNNTRLLAFFEKGCKCECCGAKGDFFALERNINKTKYFLNLYTIDINTKEIFLMVKELKIPIKLGGKDTVDNWLVVCDKCYLSYVRDEKKRLQSYNKEIIIKEK